MQGAGRTAQLHFLATDSEARRIRARAAASGLTLSSYLRRSALADGMPREPIMDMRALQPIYLELRREGGNLNQIARALNSFGAKGATAAQVRSAVSAVDAVAALVADEMRRARGERRA